MVTPTEMPMINPVELPMLPTAELLLAQVPPPEASVTVMVDPVQTTFGPPIGCAKALSVLK